MRISVSTVRRAVNNHANFTVMRYRIQMGEPLVAAGGSGGTRSEAN